MSDPTIRVPVKSWLRPATYRALESYAKQHGRPDVGSLLAELADKSVAPGNARRIKPPRERKQYTPVTSGMHARMLELSAAGLTPREIALQIGSTKTTVNIYLKRPL